MLINPHLSSTKFKCDQIDSKTVYILPLSNVKICKRTKNAKIELQFCPILNKLKEFCHIFTLISPSGEISLNPVTLHSIVWPSQKVTWSKAILKLTLPKKSNRMGHRFWVMYFSILASCFTCTYLLPMKVNIYIMEVGLGKHEQTFDYVQTQLKMISWQQQK